MQVEVETTKEYTEDERYENYCALSNAMNEIVNNKVNYEWIKEHSKLIIRYRDWISDYSKISPEIEDGEFRIKAEGIEFLLNCLCEQLKKHGTFDINVYYRLNEYIKHVVDYKISSNEEDELVNLISAMKVSST
jgi:hypothetical protein